MIINIEKIFVWSWAIGNMGFHLNKLVFVLINVELLTLKVCFIFQNYCWPLCCGDSRHLFVSFCNQQGVEGVYFCSFFLFLLLLFFLIFCQFRIIFALTSCWWLWKTISFVFSALSDWPVAEISSQQLNHFPPSYL